MIDKKLKQRIKFGIIILVVTIAIAFSAFTVIKYDVEGERKVPFELNKIIIISSATISDVNYDDGEGADLQQTLKSDTEEIEEQLNNTETQDSFNETFLWEKNVIQTNDICISLNENKEFGEEQIIKNVKIENIKIIDNVKVGKIQVYMPSSLDNGLYKYTNEFLVNSSLTYTGDIEDNKKALQVRSKGGCIYISFANMGLEAYKSNDDQEITQGAYILEKMNLTDEDLKFKVAFDLIIEVQNKAYKTNITLDLPVDGVIGQKETHSELTDFSKIVFKRM